MDLLFIILFIFDGFLVGKAISLICNRFLGDKPFARLLRLLFSVFGGVFYSVFCFYNAFGESDINMALFLVIILAPVAVLLILWIVYYMFENQNNNSDPNDK